MGGAEKYSEKTISAAYEDEEITPQPEDAGVAPNAVARF